MKNFWELQPPRHERGVVVIEFAMTLLLMVILAIPVFYVMQNIRAQTVITNVAREIANLSARKGGNTAHYSAQQIMDAATALTPPLDMRHNGTIYVTEVVAQNNCRGSVCPGKVVQKWRWNAGAGGAVPDPAWGACSQWGPRDGQCARLTATSVRLPYGFPGGHAFVVEVYYALPVWEGLTAMKMPKLNKEPLYARAIF